MVYEESGRIIDMKVVSVEEKHLRGSLTEDGLAPMTVEIAEIEQIEVERIEPVRTAFAVLGGVIILPVLLIVAALGAGLGISGG